MDTKTAWQTLRDYAEGRIHHANAGSCPDSIEGPAVRDPECPVCQALEAVAGAAPAAVTPLPAVLEQIAQGWDGCKYDAPGETLDIGADIRAAAARLLAEQPEAVAIPGSIPKELTRLADIMRDCGRLVSTSGNAEQILRTAATLLSAPTAPALEAPAAPASIVAAALVRLDAIYREQAEADCDEPPRRPDWLTTALHLAAAAPQVPAAPSKPVAVLVREIGEDSHFDHRPVRPGSDQHQYFQQSPQWDCCEVYAEAAPQAPALSQSAPVTGQCRFKGEKEWGSCTVDHVRMVLADPSYAADGYEARYLYTAPQAPAAPSDGLAADVEAVLTLLEEHEWAEHCTKTPLGQRLEAAITELHNEIHAAEDAPYAAAPAVTIDPASFEGLINAVRSLPTTRATEFDGEESDGTPQRWRNRPFVSRTQLERLLRARVAAPAAPSGDERAAFEAWIKKDGGDLSTFGSGQNRHYNNSAVNNAWTGWSSRAALAAPAAPAVDARAERDAAFEAVRNRLCGLQRYSFVLDDDGVVRRAQDRTGSWIEFDDAHALFDPVAVDAAIAAQAAAKGSQS